MRRLLLVLILPVVFLSCKKDDGIVHLQLWHQMQPDDREELVRLLQVVTLCSDVEFSGTPSDWTLEGSATEKALVELALQAGIDVMALRKQCPKLRTRDRAEGRPYMTTLHPYKNGKHLLAVKGSPEEVLEMCTFHIRQGKRVRLTAKTRQSIIIDNVVYNVGA